MGTVKYLYRSIKGERIGWIQCDKKDLLQLLNNKIFVQDCMWIKVKSEKGEFVSLKGKHWKQIG